MVSAWRNFKNIFSSPLFTIIFRPEILKFHPYSILTWQTMVRFVIYCLLRQNFDHLHISQPDITFDCSVILWLVTLDSGISVAPWINVAPGTFGKNNKHSPLKKRIPLHQITEFQTFLWITLFNNDVAPGKKSKN